MHIEGLSKRHLVGKERLKREVLNFYEARTLTMFKYLPFEHIVIALLLVILDLVHHIAKESALRVIHEVMGIIKGLLKARKIPRTNLQNSKYGQKLSLMKLASKLHLLITLDRK